MRIRPRYLGALILVAVLALTGCGGERSAEPIEPPSNATGAVVEVRPDEGDVDSFILETENDGTLEVTIDDDVDYGFDLDHLREHMDTGDPVAVELEGRDGVAYALSIEDV